MGRAGTSQGFTITANREGLMSLAVACLQMALQSETTPLESPGGFHWHFAEWNNNVEARSDDFMIVYDPDL